MPSASMFMTTLTKLLLFLVISQRSSWNSQINKVEALIITEEQVEKYGLSIEDLDDILTSECRQDFDASASSQLWYSAAQFQWNQNSDQDVNSSIAIENYDPYLVCDSTPNATGNARLQSFNNLLLAANALVGATSPFYIGDTVLNSDDRTCTLIQALSNSFLSLFAYLDGDTSFSIFVEVHPMTQSMKMSQGLVDRIQAQLDKGDNGEGDIILGINLAICPGVDAMKTLYSSTSSKSADIVNYLQENGGAQSSYFGYLVEKKEDELTNRMKFWADAANYTVTQDNECLDLFLNEAVNFHETANHSIEVLLNYSKAAEIPFATSQEQSMCVWHLLQGISNHPFVCQISPVYFSNTPGNPTSDGNDVFGGIWFWTASLSLFFMTVFFSN